MNSVKISRGFTLIEIQISILILVLIVAVLMGGLQLSTKSTKAAERMAEQSNELRIVTRLLKQQFNSIIPLAALQNGQDKLIFKGDNNSIHYMSYLSENVVKGGPWLMHFHQKNGQLLLGYRAFDNTQSIHDNFSVDFEDIVVLEEISDLSVYYYNEQLSSWQSSWHKTDKVPLAIKIQLYQAQFKWPDIIVSIHNNKATKTPFHILEIK